MRETTYCWAFEVRTTSGGTSRPSSFADTFVDRAALPLARGPALARRPARPGRPARRARGSEGLVEERDDADRVAVVDAGRIKEIGPHDELVAAGGEYAALWHSWQHE